MSVVIAVVTGLIHKQIQKSIQVTIAKFIHTSIVEVPRHSVHVKDSKIQ